MVRNQQASRSGDLADLRLRPVASRPREAPATRTIVVRQASSWQSLAILLLGLLLLAAVLLGHLALHRLEQQNQWSAATMARVSRDLQRLEAGLGYDSARRQLLLTMRDHILKANPRVSLGDAYRYAELALEASEKYPTVDPLLLLAIGIVESGYDPRARSRADARGLYQIWPSTGRILVRALGWSYDDETLYDPEVNTEAAALYLDMLFATYSDLQLVLAEYNGGPLNAGYFRASARALAAETRDYVPRVLTLYRHFADEYDRGLSLLDHGAPGSDSRPRRSVGVTDQPAGKGGAGGGEDTPEAGNQRSASGEVQPSEAR